MNSISSILSTNGPCISSELIKRIISFSSKPITEITARKQIERCKEIQKLKLNFRHNQKFYFLEYQRNSGIFWKNLIKALKINGSSYYKVLSSLRSRDGIVIKCNFPIISGLPEFSTNHLTYSKVLKDLSELDLLEKKVINETSFITYKNTNIIYSDFNAKYFLETTLLEFLKSLLQKFCLASYNNIEIRSKTGKLPQFSGFFWDLVGISYISPLFQNNKPGFIVADLIYSKKRKRVTIEEVEYFVYKFKAAKNHKNSNPFIAFLMANEFTKTAFKYCKDNGILPLSLRNIIHSELDLDNILRIFEIVYSQNDFIPLSFMSECLAKPERYAGLLGLLKGRFFELIIAHCLRTNGYPSLRLWKKVDVKRKGEKKELEIDIFSDEQNKPLLFVECKAESCEITKQKLKDWFEKEIKPLCDWVKENNTYKKKMCFEYWASGKFSEEAKKFIKTFKFNRCIINFKDQNDILEFIKNSEDHKEILAILTQYYFNNDNFFEGFNNLLLTNKCP